MKSSSLILLAFAVAPVVSFAQRLPDDPAPVSQAISASNPASPSPGASSDAVWARVHRIANGREIVITNTYGPPLRCRFAGATDAYLFCDPLRNPASTGYQFERASVLDVRVMREPLNWHPGLLSAMIGGGLITGITATSHTDAGHAAQIGVIGALVSGAIAAPVVFLQPQNMYGGVGVGVAFRPPGFHHWHQFRTAPANVPRR